MKRILLIIALFIIAKLSGAQGVIWNTSNYQKGIHKTYAEFITIKPSLDYDAFEIQDKKASCGLTSFKTLDVKRFKIKNKEAKKIEGIVGFSDGTHVYINPAALNGFNSKTNFYTVEFYQQFAFIEFIKTTTIRNGSYTSNSNDAAKGVFHLNNGKFLELNKFKMKDILESDPELLEAFKNEIGKEKKVKEYFIKYINKLNKKDS